MENDIPPYKWFIGVLADGSYRFITPDTLKSAEDYIGKHGGGIYSHAGYLIFASNKTWWNFLTKEYELKNAATPDGMRPPHIDVPNLECYFSESAIKWLQDNESLLEEKGGKYYDYIPRH